MRAEVLDQARSLANTVRLLRKHVVRAHAKLASEHRAERPWCDLTFPQVNMLLIVREKGAVSIKELAEALQVSAPSASAMVDRLVEMGALTREQSHRDRREVIVALSPQAEVISAKMEEGLLGSIVDILERLGPEYADMWCQVYEKIGAILSEEEKEEEAGRERLTRTSS